MLLRRGSPTSAQLLWRLVASAPAAHHPHHPPARAPFSTNTPAASEEPTPLSHPPAPTRAIVRAVSRGFADAIVSSAAGGGGGGGDSRIDAARATEQHARYLALLREAVPSLGVVELDAPDYLPDACFVEDTAVMVPGSWLPRQAAPSDSSSKRGVAVIARPAAPSRASEPEAVARALRGHELLRDAVEVVGEIVAPGTLDGGDVLILPPPPTAAAAAADASTPTTVTVLVGLSGRTNAEGAAQLRDLLAPRGVRVVPVPMAAALKRAPGLMHGPPSSSSFHPLHLKSAVTALSADSLLCADGPAGRAVAAAVHGALLRASPLLPPPAAGGGASSSSSASAAIPILPTFAFLPEEDACAANVLLLGDAVVAQPALEASRRVLEFLCERLGRRLVLLDPPLGEMKKADGALTCCSILF